MKSHITQKIPHFSQHHVCVDLMGNAGRKGLRVCLSSIYPLTPFSVFTNFSEILSANKMT